ncbi:MULTISPECIES: sugar phosphate isomerase/epimerase [unclassified Cellvibrio]|jgi:sugar phosphate isomerase/epimerase|uniref:sugar phosphate isomerase/epimerase family protein n=1 Tax=unclassified Cellvibrio TaxID=2624793 RepID=UPI001248F19F|nr:MULTISPECIES: sugar phosphate isomerase/epimerase [unclassified Cellvibrio]QEY12018.1 sugar phosphate isomerase/epimerase [Cellvibrio sp. KY-YJ-3]UUA72221.1 sugar phosphate isomerase/epimerase [Cellvibrio sp. QJXJ]
MTLSNTIKALTMAAITSVSLSAMAADVAPTSPQLSVQLWSVKDDVAKDFEGTLKKLKAMGFQGVEFAGNFGAYANDPKGLKAFLDKTGLKASAAHVPFEKLNAENFDATVAFYKAIDCKYLIIPMDMRAFTTDGAKEVAADLAAIQTKLTPHGMHTGYHNHEGEMLGKMGETPWDVIGTNTTKEVVLQQDVGWTEVAGKDPIAFIKAYPGRTITTHYKASAPKPGNTEHPIIGQDTTDWKALIEANKTYGGTLWLVVEQESYPEGMTPMQSVEASLKGLQKVISDMK